MGIPFFYTHIIKSHPNILNKFTNSIESEAINNLYLDCNSIIYDCLRNFTNVSEEKLIEATIKRIEEIIELLVPTSKCLIAFDGVAPLSKLHQQRIRRFKSSFEKQAKQELKIPIESNGWDTNTITPGTNFTTVLSKQVQNYFKEKETFSKIEFIVSACDCKGEGEHKIFSYITNNLKYHSNTTTVVYGLDADLIMLALIRASSCRKLFLYRETPTYIKSINDSLSDKDHYLLDVKMLKERVNALLTDDPLDTTDRINDYVFLCFFLGNDFLPHTPSINIRNDGISILIDAYKKTISSMRTSSIHTPGIQTPSNLVKEKPSTLRLISANGRPVWLVIKKLIFELKTNEHERIKNEHASRSRFNCKETTISNERFNFIPLIDRRVEEYINPSEHMWQSRYYNKLFNITGQWGGISRKQVCSDYIKSLDWTLSYYLSGCVDWRWGYHYLYTPLLDDLYQFIPTLNTVFFNKIIDNPVNPQTQLAYVLPKTSYHLLDKKVVQLMDTNKYRNYHDDISLVWAYCKYFWESKLVFNNDIDINDLENDIKATLHIKY